jgi:hypothetical protein
MLLLRFVLIVCVTMSAAGFAIAQAAQISQPDQQPTSTTALPGQGLVEHPFLYCGEWQQRGKSEQTIYIVQHGKVACIILSREETAEATLGIAFQTELTGYVGKREFCPRFHRGPLQKL